MRCFHCGSMLPDNVKFCRVCGTHFVKDQFCRVCGTQIKDGTNFCMKCGRRAEPMKPAVPVAEPVKRTVAVAEAPATKKKKTVRWGLILGALAVAALLAIGIVLILQAKDKEPAPKAASAPNAANAADAAEQVLYLEMYNEYGETIGCASGFLIEDELTLVTNYHVIEDAYSMVAMTSNGEDKVEVSTVLAADRDADLAILRCEDEIGVSPLPIGDSDKAKQGDTVYAAGYPLGLANTLSDGIISSRYEDNGIDTIQITAAISGGSSGGALLNEKGQVIGVICAYYENGQNMNLAISSAELMDLYESIDKTVELDDFYEDTHLSASTDRYEETTGLDTEFAIQYIAYALFEAADASWIFDLFPEDILVLLKEGAGEEYEALIEEMNAALAESIEAMDAYDWYYGVEILDETTLDSYDIARIERTYEDDYGIELTIDEAVQVDTQVSLTAEGVEETVELSLTFVLIDEEWYLDPTSIS